MTTVLLLVIGMIVGGCLALVNNNNTTTTDQQTTRAGGPAVAQCQARCYQLVSSYHPAHKIGDSIEQDQASLSADFEWECEETLDSQISCSQCLRELNTTLSDCGSICMSIFENECKNSCQCLHHVKEENTMTRSEVTSPSNITSTPNSRIELVCRDIIKKEGAMLVLRLIPSKKITQHVALVVELQPQGGHSWTEALISDDLTMELRGLDYQQVYTVKVSMFGPNGILETPTQLEGLTTLPENHVPNAVSEFKVTSLTFDTETESLAANVTWRQASDKVCCVDLVTFNKMATRRICEPDRSWFQILNNRVDTDLILRLHTVTRGSEDNESEAVNLIYSIPSCPYLGPNITTQQQQKFCNVTKLSKPCVEEVPSIGVGKGGLFDVHVSWYVPSLQPHEPRIDFFRVTLNPGPGTTPLNIRVDPRDNQEEGGIVRIVIPGVKLSSKTYNVNINAENKLSKQGPHLNIRRRLFKRIPQRGNLADPGADDCPRVAPVSDFPPYLLPASPGASTGAPVDGVPTTMSPTTVAAGAATLVLLGVVFAVFGVRRYARSRSHRNILSRNYFQNVEKGCKSCPDSNFHQSEYEPLKKKMQDLADISALVPVPSHMHVKLENLRLGTVLGEGAFGIVRCGQMRRSRYSPWKTVAVKMLKDGASVNDRREFHREVSLMKSVGKHPHLVCMLACTAPHESTVSPLLVVEHCELGDLQHFLRQQWRRLTAKPTIKYAELDTATTTQSNGSLVHGLQTVVNPSYGLQDTTVNKTENTSGETDDEIVSAAELLSIARQVALGMEFLSGNRVVHRDLAARNVLVTAERSVKIADFGLSRDVYEQNVYHKTSEGRLPIKWMALESLLHQMYTTSSDVWSFGILLWEIVTLGGTPYPGIATSRVFPLLRSGYRMERPDNCSEQLYDVMLNCWQTQPQDRPNFSQLKEKIEILLETCTDSGSYLPLHDYAESSASSTEEATLPITPTTDVSYLQPVTNSCEET